MARQSEIFQSMFGIPQPSMSFQSNNYTWIIERLHPPARISAKLLEGCQIIRMFDLPVELASLLKALYDGVYASQPFGTIVY